MATLDLHALGRALNQRRHQRGLTIEATATELNTTPEEVAALEAGGEPRLTVAMAAVTWLDMDLGAFLIDDVPQTTSDPAAEAESVAAYLRSDRGLKPESAQAIEAVLRAAYERFSAA